MGDGEPGDAGTLLPTGPVGSIEEAIEVMAAISEALPVTDGLACFNRMYLIVTEKVRAEVSGPAFFADPAFTSRLDVVFVNLYLGAIAAWQSEPPHAPACWAELLERRSDPHIAPIQFALAGMSAHINHDLPLAVVGTCEERDTTPDAGAHAADFEKVNTLLGSLDQQIRESFETGVILEADRRVAGLENVVGNFAIDAARRAAWLDAENLWRLRHHKWLSREYADGLDDAAAAAGRSLMLPTS